MRSNNILCRRACCAQTESFAQDKHTQPDTCTTPLLYHWVKGLYPKRSIYANMAYIHYMERLGKFIYYCIFPHAIALSISLSKCSKSKPFSSSAIGHACFWPSNSSFQDTSSAASNHCKPNQMAPSSPSITWKEAAPTKNTQTPQPRGLTPLAKSKIT